MKKRLVKKWIKRYLHHFVKDLERVNTHRVYEEVNIGNDLWEARLYQSVSIINGHVTGEGEMYRKSQGLRQDILKTRETLLELMAKSDKTFLRIYPVYEYRTLYLRILIRKYA